MHFLLDRVKGMNNASKQYTNPKGAITMSFKRKLTQQIEEFETSVEGQESPLAKELFKKIDAELERIDKEQKKKIKKK